MRKEQAQGYTVICHCRLNQKGRGGVEDPRLEAKAKNTKKIRGQGQPFRGQNLSRPRTAMLEAKAKDTVTSVLQKKKVFKKFFQAISNLLAYPEFLVGEA